MSDSYWFANNHRIKSFWFGIEVDPVRTPVRCHSHWFVQLFATVGRGLYWPFVRGIHRGPVNSPHKGQWRGALMFSLICVWINGWVNNGEAGDLRRHRAHYDVIVMGSSTDCRRFTIGGGVDNIMSCQHCVCQWLGSTWVTTEGNVGQHNSKLCYSEPLSQ